MSGAEEKPIYKYNYYRREDCELMNAGPPLDFSFRNATNMEGMGYVYLVICLRKISTV